MRRARSRFCGVGFRSLQWRAGDVSPRIRSSRFCRVGFQGWLGNKNGLKDAIFELQIITFDRGNVRRSSRKAGNWHRRIHQIDGCFVARTKWRRADDFRINDRWIVLS